jgi:NAD(P)H-dependent FMN reductase
MDHRSVDRYFLRGRNSVNSQIGAATDGGRKRNDTRKGVGRMKVLAFAASLRKDSWNKKLCKLAVDVAKAQGVDVDHADFREFDMPYYDGDLQAASGFPAGAQKLAKRLADTDGWILVSPEYNYSVPGTIKNAIDWLSRMNPMPFRGKNALLLSASVSLVGGIRGLWQLRIPLEGCGCWVHPDMYALATVQNALDGSGKIKDAALAKRLEDLITDYLRTAKALNAR